MMQMRRGVRLRTLLFFLALTVGSTFAASAPDQNSVLYLGSTVKNASSSIEAYQAAKAGYTVVFATDADWAAMTAADFASYREIIFGDSMCDGKGTLGAAVANQPTWAQAITGNVIVMANHPGKSSLAGQSAKDFVSNAVQFAASGQGTGAYIALGCYMSAEKQTTVSLLKPFGLFSVLKQNGCFDTAYLTAGDPGLGTMNDAEVTGWDCTSNTEFTSWPSSFAPLVVGQNTSGHFVDTATNNTVAPYVLVRGSQVTRLTTLLPSPTSTLAAATLPSPTVPGDPVVDVDFPMTGHYDFFNDTINLTTSDGDWGLVGNVNAYLNWTPHSKVSVEYNNLLMEQGDSPGMTDTLDPGHGNLCLGFDASLDALLDGNHLNLASVSQSVCGDCPLKTDGTPYNCSLAEQDVELYCGGIGLVDACIWLTVTPTTTLTADPFTTDRTLFFDASAEMGPDALALPPNSAYSDPVNLSCVAPPGADVVYQLANPRTTAPFSQFAIDLGVAGGFEECVPLVGCAKQKVIDEPHLLSIPVPIGGVTVNLSGPSGQVDLGPIKKESSFPDLSKVVANWSGNEGSPIQFSAAGAKDKCLDYSSLVWNYSDHGIAYGFSPFHTFQDGGTYSGQLVVTNVGGNTATKSLTIGVNNLPPVVTAGPDTTAAWGRLVAFNGSATSPGADDQSTLVYSWTFGDGTPSATGGPSVQHAYSAPGTYTSTFKACDNDGMCASSSRQVIVRKRNVTLGYLGDQQGIYNVSTNMSGSLVDEFGAVVSGRTLSFAIGAESGGSVATNSSGIASSSHVVGLSAGAYTASATFSGDSLYNAASPSTTAYTVSQKPTSVSYTGVLTGGPNKTVSLSAVLVDSQNKPLAGKVIAFKLGSQSASATTNSSGVAATTITLNQKNGSYPLTATYSPAGGDAGLYLGSVASATFKIQTK